MLMVVLFKKKPIDEAISDADGVPRKRKRKIIPSSSSLSSKKSKRSSIASTSELSNLPEVLLVGILCRLPLKSVVLCKGVSKRWFTLISSNLLSFINFQQQHHDEPNLHTLVICSRFLPMCKTTRRLSRDFKLSDYCFQDLGSKKRRRPVVVGTQNDLVLWCARKKYQRHYYICNPYTKQCVALPPTPGLYKHARMGFTCDPYYIYESSSPVVKELNADYRCRVVRLLPKLWMEIFSSETGQWREMMLCPTVLGDIYELKPSFFKQIVTAGFAYNGKLYWCGGRIYKSPPFTFELDPFCTSTTTTVNANGGGGDIIDVFDSCRFIEGPLDLQDLRDYCFPVLGVCRGTLRACNFELSGIDDRIRIWELREEVGGKMKWHLTLDKLLWLEMISSCEDTSIDDSEDSFEVLGFHPNNKDILYISVFAKVVICNIRSKKLEMLRKSRLRNDDTPMEFHQFELPPWPTRVPKIYSSMSITGAVPHKQSNG